MVQYSLTNKNLLQTIFTNLIDDHEHAVALLISSLRVFALRTDVPGRTKSDFFTQHRLLAIARLYHASSDGNTNEKRRRKDRDVTKKEKKPLPGTPDGAAAAANHAEEKENEPTAVVGPPLVFPSSAVLDLESEDTDNDADAEAENDADTMRPMQPVPEAVHQLLLAVCSDPVAGLCVTKSAASVADASNDARRAAVLLLDDQPGPAAKRRPAAANAADDEDDDEPMLMDAAPQLSFEPATGEPPSLAAMAWKQGWDRSRVAHENLASFITKLPDSHKHPLKQQLVLAVLQACPDLLPLYFHGGVSPYEPALNLDHVLAMNFAFRALHQLPVLPLDAPGVVACLQHRVESALPDAFSPRRFTKVTQALSAGAASAAAVPSDDTQQSSQPQPRSHNQLLLYGAVQVLVVCLRRAEAVLTEAETRARNEPPSARLWLEFHRSFAAALGKRVPPAALLVELVGKTQSWPLLQSLLLRALQTYLQYLPEATGGLTVDHLLMPSRRHLALHPAVRTKLYGMLRHAASLEWQGAAVDQQRLKDKRRRLHSKAKGSTRPGTPATVADSPAPAEESGAAAVQEGRLTVLLNTLTVLPAASDGSTQNQEARELIKLVQHVLDESGVFACDAGLATGSEAVAWLRHLPAHQDAVRVLDETIKYARPKVGAPRGSLAVNAPDFAALLWSFVISKDPAKATVMETLHQACVAVDVALALLLDETPARRQTWKETVLSLMGQRAAVLGEHAQACITATFDKLLGLKVTRPQNEADAGAVLRERLQRAQKMVSERAVRDLDALAVLNEHVAVAILGLPWIDDAAELSGYLQTIVGLSAELPRLARLCSSVLMLTAALVSETCVRYC